MLLSNLLNQKIRKLTYSKGEKRWLLSEIAVIQITQPIGLLKVYNSQTKGKSFTKKDITKPGKSRVQTLGILTTFYGGDLLNITYKQKYNKKYGFSKNKSHSIKEIAKQTGYQESGLRTIYKKGKGAFFTNPSSVRPGIKSPNQWGMARVYAAINRSSKAHRIDKIHLKKKR